MDLLETLPRLLQATADGKLAWDEFGTAAYIAPVGTVFVSIRLNGSSYILSLINEAGNTLEQLAFSILDGEPYRQTKSLYEGARRRALNIDGALLELQKGLDSL